MIREKDLTLTTCRTGAILFQRPHSLARSTTQIVHTQHN